MSIRSVFFMSGEPSGVEFCDLNLIAPDSVAYVIYEGERIKYCAINKDHPKVVWSEDGDSCDFIGDYLLEVDLDKELSINVLHELIDKWGYVESEYGKTDIELERNIDDNRDSKEC